MTLKKIPLEGCSWRGKTKRESPNIFEILENTFSFGVYSLEDQQQHRMEERASVAAKLLQPSTRLTQRTTDLLIIYEKFPKMYNPFSGGYMESRDWKPGTRDCASATLLQGHWSLSWRCPGRSDTHVQELLCGELGLEAQLIQVPHLHFSHRECHKINIRAKAFYGRTVENTWESLK